MLIYFMRCVFQLKRAVEEVSQLTEAKEEISQRCHELDLQVTS